MRRISAIILLTLVTSLAILATGCGSTMHLPSSSYLKPYTPETKTVYVTNPELSRELAILQSSRLYAFTNAEQAPARLTLHPLRQYGGCANPLLLSIITFGVVPGYMPGGYEFSYELEGNDRKQTLAHRLPIYERFSIWEHLIHQDSVSIFGEALRNSDPVMNPN